MGIIPHNSEPNYKIVLAKFEPSIAKHYNDVVVKDAKAKELGSNIRKIHHSTEATVLDLAGHKTFCETNSLLQRVLAVRSPYVDCNNLLQAEILKRLRACNDEE